MGAVLKKAVKTLPPHQAEVFLAVLEQLRWFAGLQIRNVAVSKAVSAPLITVKCINHIYSENVALSVILNESNEVHSAPWVVQGAGEIAGEIESFTGNTQSCG